MKKYSELDARQKKAWKNVKYAAEDYIFGLQNGCLDNTPDSQGYQDYMEELKNLEALKRTVYIEAINSVYGNGFCGGGSAAQAYIKDIRFCGKDFIMEVVDHFCRKYQAEALNELNG